MARPKIHNTPEELAEAKRRWKAKSAEKTKNITVDAELVEALNEQADKLEEVFGFRPTLSQTLRYLIKKATA